MCDDSCVNNDSGYGSGSGGGGRIECAAYGNRGRSTSMKKSDIPMPPEIEEMAMQEYYDLQALGALKVIDEELNRPPSAVELDYSTSKVLSAVSLQDYTGVQGGCECGASDDANEIMQALDKSGNLDVYDPEEELNDVLAPRNVDLSVRTAMIYKSFLSDLIQMEKGEKETYDTMLEEFQARRRTNLSQQK